MLVSSAVVTRPNADLGMLAVNRQIRRVACTRSGDRTSGIFGRITVNGQGNTLPKSHVPIDRTGDLC
jgi:hypothetical protein